MDLEDTVLAGCGAGCIGASCLIGLAKAVVILGAAWFILQWIF